jgi:hypothetical protein
MCNSLNRCCVDDAPYPFGSISVSCKIVNAGTIPANMTVIQREHVEEAHTATIFPGSSYSYRFEIDCRDAKIDRKNSVGGYIVGTLKYFHFFDHRKRNFNQRFEINQFGATIKTEDGGNNDEADTDG